MLSDLYKQQIKTIFIQLAVGIVCAVFLLMLTNAHYLAPVFSILTGLVYTLLLAVGVNISNKVSAYNHSMGMAVLAVSAVFRFILIGIMFIIVMNYWGKYPLEVILPFVVMLISPFFLLIGKKRLTD